MIFSKPFLYFDLYEFRNVFFIVDQSPCSMAKQELHQTRTFGALRNINKLRMLWPLKTAAAKNLYWPESFDHAFHQTTKKLVRLSVITEDILSSADGRGKWSETGSPALLGVEFKAPQSRQNFFKPEYLIDAVTIHRIITGCSDCTARCSRSFPLRPKWSGYLGELYGRPGCVAGI